MKEAQEYKTKKEGFTLLEETAYIDAKKILKEKAHIERMQEYLHIELDSAKNGANSPAIEQIEALANDAESTPRKRAHGTSTIKKDTEITV
jgi:hypothetical protein